MAFNTLSHSRSEDDFLQKNHFTCSTHLNTSSHTPPIVWSIAGSDSGGGAGIQADLRAFNLFGVHGCTAIAAITAQNSIAVEKIEAASPEVLDAQLAVLARDLPPVVIKTGMLATVENVGVVAKWVDHLRTQYPKQPVALVVDPILRASTGARFADEALRKAIVHELLPRASLVKPNLKEAVWLVTGTENQSSHADLNNAPELAKALRAFGAQAVVITGGDVFDPLRSSSSQHSPQWAVDWLDTPNVNGWLSLPRVLSTATHGTGCTFTASAAAAMALGFCAADAAILAKMATTNAVQHGYRAGAGAGVACIQPDFALQPDLIPYLRATPDQGLKPFAPLQNNWMGLYPIVDSAQWVQRVIKAGAKTVQLRIKSNDERLKSNKGFDFLSNEIKRAVAYAQAGDVQFFVNDHWELALQHGAYGVHLGQEDFLTADLEALRKAGLRLGVSTNSIWEVCIARAVAPSYYACGPVYETQSKELSWLTQGENNLTYWCKVLDKPIVAIAGINVARSTEVVRCGAQGVAVISAITHADDPEHAIAGLQHAIVKGQTLARYVAPTLPHSVL